MISDILLNFVWQSNSFTYVNESERDICVCYKIFLDIKNVAHLSCQSKEQRGKENIHYILHKSPVVDLSEYFKHSSYYLNNSETEKAFY